MIYECDDVRRSNHLLSGNSIGPVMPLIEIIRGFF